MNDTYHALVKQLKACDTETKLYKLVSYISNNAAQLKLDEWDLQKLEQVGMQRYDAIQRAGQGLIANSKIGMKKYDGDE